MKALILLGGTFAAVAFTMAMQTALTPQHVQVKRPPVVEFSTNAVAQTSGGCCAKKESSGCTRMSQAGCPHSAQTAESGRTPAQP